MSPVRLFAQNAIRFARLFPLCAGQYCLHEAQASAKAWALSGAERCGLRAPDAIASFGGGLASSLVDFGSRHGRADIAFAIDFDAKPNHLAESLSRAAAALDARVACLGFHWSIPEYGASAFALASAQASDDPSFRGLPPNIIDALHRGGSTHSYRFSNGSSAGLAASALWSYAYQLKFDIDAPESFALAPISLCERLDLEALRKDLGDNPVLRQDNVERAMSLAQQVFERREIDESTPQALPSTRRRPSL